MAIYVVMEPPRGGRADDEVYVRDGFHWLGFLLPLIWLLWNRLWIETLLLLVVVLALGVAAETWGVTETIVAALSLLVSIYVGIEGAALRIWALRRRGYSEWGVVEAADRRDAETWYLAASDATRASEDRPLPPIRPAATAPAPSSDSEPQLGLFGYPGKR